MRRRLPGAQGPRDADVEEPPKTLGQIFRRIGPGMILAASIVGSGELIATTTLTLFVPCVAQFAVTIKERGWKTALAISAFIFPFAFLVGALLNWILTALQVVL